MLCIIIFYIIIIMKHSSSYMAPSAERFSEPQVKLFEENKKDVVSNISNIIPCMREWSHWGSKTSKQYSQDIKKNSLGSQGMSWVTWMIPVHHNINTRSALWISVIISYSNVSFGS